MATATEAPDCPKCQGAMWDNRDSKKNPKQPDFKCKDRGCDGVIWPPRTEKKNGAKPSNEKQAFTAGPALPGEPAEGAPDAPVVSKAEQLLKTCKMHLAITKFVTENESKVLHETDVGDSPEALSTRVNTIFIQACQRGLDR